MFSFYSCFANSIFRIVGPFEIFGREQTQKSWHPTIHLFPNLLSERRLFYIMETDLVPADVSVFYERFFRESLQQL